MSAVGRLGDTSSHGGTVISASTTTLANRKGIARTGDLHSCPIRGHGVTAFNSTCTTKSDGKSVVRVGIDSCGCGAVVVGGSPDVNAQ